MGILRKNKEIGGILKEKAPEYWEETSYFRILPENSKLDPADKIVERIKSINDVDLVDFQPFSTEAPGTIIVSYKGDVY